MSARTGLTTIIEQVRNLTQAGTAEWTLGTASYFDDDHMQVVLDANRRDYFFAPTAIVPEYGPGGTLIYKRYDLPAAQWETTTAGTAIFYLQDVTGGTIGTALWSADYTRGRITFASSTAGSAYYVTGSAYDVYGAAADVLEQWASHEKTAFDVTTAGGSYRRSQKVDLLLKMAGQYRAMTQVDTSIDLYRSDVCEED